MSKFFVTGASGMLGTTLYDYFLEEGQEVISTDLDPLDPWTRQLDIRDLNKVRSMIEDAHPDWVLNLAALTDVEYCERNVEEAFDTNAKGPENVATVCKELGIPMVHISTAGVFDGTRTIPYTEEDEPNPVNIYGKAKHEGDKAVQRLLEHYYIFRAGWMMGSGARDKKFVKKVLNLIDKGHNTIYGLTDVYGCPTYTLDFAKAILYMIRHKPPYGLYHSVSEGSCSRYDVAATIKKVLGLDHIELKPVTGDFFKETFFAPRPPFEIIENKKIHDLKWNVMRNWEEATVEYLTTYYVDEYKKKKAEYASGKEEKSE